MNLSKYSDLAIMYAGEYSLKIVAALAIFFIGKWVVRKITALIKKLMLKAQVDLTLIKFLEKVLYFSLLVVITLASLNALDINTTSFIALFGAASLAVGLALKDSLSNIGAAILIIIFRPFKVGDLIDAAGASGTVEEINLFSSIMLTPDNKSIIIPNSSIINSNITNYSSKPIRRINLVFGIDYTDDLKLAKETLMQIIKEDERVLLDPAPLVAVGELAENSVNFVFRVWVKTEQYWNVHFDMLEKVKLAFDEKGISIPFPQINVHLQGQKSE
ncbi:mechanosensitive ion channel domain-containing protein [Sulfurimonas sp.]|jgi:small conductance mechanosensitive channel|uniref:mechanosensitive ion channel family protein n=1 Tax=Sulfurimonas sp. TaxID=2022749 RepID=UPI002601145D|nr:mechanosensitive ion channel domain-containing protein [Sulfurimonas sp.]MCK9473299.1 mechanosensitive ion channel [Sulfurimonas sp.]MDD3504998.1 mechanosensitive ion channel [Sulfurimonas sp.]